MYSNKGKEELNEYLTTTHLVSKAPKMTQSPHGPSSCAYSFCAFSASANKSHKEEWIDVVRSFTSIKGPRILPCGPPCVTGSSLEKQLVSVVHVGVA